MRRRQQENNMFIQEQNNDSPQDFRRPLQPPIFDRPVIGGNGPHNLMDLPMVCPHLPFSYSYRNLTGGVRI